MVLTVTSTRCPVRPCRWPLWAHSFCGSVGSALMAARSWLGFGRRCGSHFQYFHQHQYGRSRRCCGCHAGLQCDLWQNRSDHGLNGAIGGLVSITAEPLTPSIPCRRLHRCVGGVLVVLTVPLFDKLKIDDVVGAIPAHLWCAVCGAR